MDNDKVELKVSTWLAVLAEMARSRAKLPTIDSDDFEAQIMDGTIQAMDSSNKVVRRRALLSVAALAMRMLDEHFPGDGLEF